MKQVKELTVLIYIMCFKFMKCDMRFPFLMNAKLIDGQFKFLKQNFFFPNNSFFFCVSASRKPQMAMKFICFVHRHQKHNGYVSLFFTGNKI